MNWQFPRWRRVSPLLPGGMAALIFLIFLKLGILNSLEQITYITLFQLRAEVPWDKQVVVVAIDDPSIRQLGRFPWSRKYYTALLKKLSTAKANLVVFDIVFSETTPEDIELAESMRQHGMVILAQAWDNQGNPWVPTPTLTAAAITTGHIIKYQDSDGITRQITPLLQDIPALGLTAAQVYTAVWNPVQMPDLNKPLWINYPGSTRNAPLYSFADVLQGKVPAQVFKDKIILVGVTAVGIDSVNSTPFDPISYFSGVYLHAVVINNLLRQTFLHSLPPESLLTILVLVNIAWSIVIIRWKLRWQLIGWLGVCVGWGIVSLLALKLAYWLLPVVSPIISISLSTVFVVISQRLKQEVAIQDLQHEINIDALTQIANRRRFNEYLNQEWQRAARGGTTLSLLLCDVDFFKKYNDTYGHQAGDGCLQQVSLTMQQSVNRSADLVARYGGEEFAVILPNTDAAGAMHIAEIIRVRIKELGIPHKASEVDQCVTLSIGVSTIIPFYQDSEKALIVKADQALYVAKKEGRDRISFKD
jgi:adenylate cyclase